MSFETTIAAFAAALTDPTAPPPTMTMGRESRPDARRFGVYRNNVAVGLIKSLEARYPVTRRLVGEDFFRGMAGAYVGGHKPETAVLILYGADFPEFVRGFEPARELNYLPDVAALENAWVEAYHAAEAEPWPLALLADIAPERLETLRFRIHPATRLARFATPAASVWSAHQGEGEPAPPQHWGGEDVLVTRPHAEVSVRVLPDGGHDFLAGLRAGAELGEAALPLIEAGADPGAHLVGLIEAGAIAGLA
jgi:Putative DNA-binding domain